MTLNEFFREHPRVALAFSGGVDSAYLLYAALQAGAQVRAYYVKSPFQPGFELEDARRLARELGADMVELPLDVLTDENVVKNPANRCYYCKKRIFSAILNAARADGFDLLMDGTNASDDLSDRPGFRALQELQVRSPLREAGLTKPEIRELSRQAGVEIADDEALLQMLQELAQTKKLYDKVQTALEQVKATGYGIVMPGAEELKLEKPEIVKKNGNYAVKLRASAPSIHMLRAQIETEISPMVGGEQESQQLIDYLLGEYEEDTDKLWQSNIFGKSLYELVSEGVTAKIMRMPDDARQKLTKTLGRMINENTGGMICILL